MNRPKPQFLGTYSGPLRLSELAIECKILSAIFWIFVASLKICFDLATLDSPDRPRDIPVRDWNNPAYFYRICLGILVLFVIALVALVPNRWLVSSRKIFGAALAVALIPPCTVFIQSCRDEPFITLRDCLVGAPLIAVFFAPLPMSIVLSFWRKQRGEKIKYA